MKLVYVEWYDSYGCSPEWIPLARVKAPSLICTSVGWVHLETDEMIVVVPHVTADDHDRATYSGCGDMSIPKCAIKRLVELTVPFETTARHIDTTAPAEAPSPLFASVSWLGTINSPEIFVG